MSKCDDEETSEEARIARRWCEKRGPEWRIVDKAGEGGTAPVFRIDTPEGPRALKIYNEEFSTGARSRSQEERVELQKKIGVHDCESLVKVYDGGRFEERLYLLMSCAPGHELEKVLPEVPRTKIRHIVDQVAKAALFLEKNGFTHRDIKSANVFVDENYAVVTLLDISTMRDITDPVGVGTDHGDQLPVVATARYSPPEYLFRLVEPPKLWALVDVYQLGGLLHDLIMREPMFRQEYDAAKENRYRFAHSVATITPTIAASDVDTDLIFLARRALVRDWRQREDLTVEDFLDGRKTRQGVALSMLGLGEREPPKRSKKAKEIGHIMAVGRQVETIVAAKLREQRVTTQHHLEPLDIGVELTFSWMTSAEEGSEKSEIELSVRLQTMNSDSGEIVQGQVVLSGMPGTGGRKADVLLPPTAFEDDCAESLSASILAALGNAAVKLAAANEEGV